MADEYDLEELIEKPYKKKEESFSKNRYGDYAEDYGAERTSKEHYDNGSSGDMEMEEKIKKHKHKKSHKSKNHEKKKKSRMPHNEEYDKEVYQELVRKTKKRQAMESDGSDYERHHHRRRHHHRHHRRHLSDSDSSHHDSPPTRFDSPLHRTRSPRRSYHRSRERSYESPQERRRSSHKREMRSRERSRHRSPRREERSPSKELTSEERDARTIFCMQLSTRLRPIDLKDFFGKIGKIRDVRLIMDNRSRRSKGIAYIEFKDLESATKSLSLNGQKLLGVPIIIQPSHGDRNRSNLPITTATGKPGQIGPMKLYVGSLHYNITEDMLRGLFEPFGQLDDLKLMKDTITGKSAGYGFLQYRKYEDGKKALEQLNGYEIAGRPMKLGSVAEYQLAQGTSNLFDADEVDKVGFGMSATSRIQLMAKLAEGTGFEIPKAAASVLKPESDKLNAPPIATQCFLLSNMFTSKEMKDEDWEKELRDEVLEECAKHGGVLHLHIDKNSPQGHIYIKCPTIAAAMASVNTLHGRFFAGRQITAAYVPLPSYHSLFPQSIKATHLIQSSNNPPPSNPYFH